MFIFTDVGADLPNEYLAKNDIPCLKLSVIIDGKEYENVEDAGISGGIEGFYEFLRGGGRTSTSQVNEHSYYEAFKPILAGGNDLVYIGLSKGISGSFNSAVLAANRLKEEFPDNTAYLCDTMCASLGLGLVVDKAVQFKSEGKSCQEFYEWHRENAMRFNHWFTVDDLKFLARGGRISSTAAVVGSLIKIKPVLNVNEEGKLISREKVRGRKASIQALANHMFASCREGDQKVFISHGDCLDDALYLKSLVQDRLGISDENFIINHVGYVIGAHSGPGTLALFYFGDERYYKPL
ncbi:MAG: DegV family protein [Christensenellales bacterium]